MQKRYIPADEPIDLLNVAFENPRKQAGNQNPNRKKKGKPNTEGHTGRNQDVASDPSTSYLVPDRETGLECVAELRQLCPLRIWNFVSPVLGLFYHRMVDHTSAYQVEVDVPFEQYQAAKPLVEELMFPCRTVMDLVCLFQFPQSAATNAFPK